MVRLVSGVVLAAVFFALIWFGNATVLLVVALVVATLAVHEYVQLFKPLGANIPLAPTLFATWAAAAVVPFPRVPLELVISISIIVIAVWVMATVPGEGFNLGAASVFAGAFAPVYIGVPLGALVAIHVYGGRGAVILLMATIVVSDSAQFYSGRVFGRHKLAPVLSPKKTIEGAIGGLVLAPVFLIAVAYQLVPAATNQVLLGLLAVAVVAAGIAGDLFESMLKRASGLKDSSALIPGHGGVLDRIDSLLFASPIFYWFIRELFS